MTGATRPKQTVRFLLGFIALSMVLTGFLTVWHPGAGAQDGTDFAGTAVAENTPTAYVEPTPTPTRAPITYEAPAFIDGTFRIVVQRAAWASEIEELELNSRSGRMWLPVVVDVINFSDIATSVTPSEFTIRTAGGETGGLAKSTTEQVAARMDMEPGDIDDGQLLQPGESERFLLVFQLAAGLRDPALVYEFNAVPLATRIGQGLGFTRLPPVSGEPRLTSAVVAAVSDGNTVQLVGDFSGEEDLAGVDAPVGDDCFAEESTAWLQTIVNLPVLVEEPGDGQDGIYLWLPLQTGNRILVNQDLIISGYATSSAAQGGRFTDWLNDSLFVSKLRTAGLWGRCTGPHGTNRPGTVERITFETSFDGEDAAPYIPWVDWSPLILSLPDTGAIAFFSAQELPDDPATPVPADQLERRLFYTLYDPAEGDWSVAEPLPDGGRLQFGISGVVDSQGRVHIVYSDRRADSPAATSTLKYMVREVNGSWSRPENVAPNSLAGHQLSPSLAIDEDDTLYVVWQDQRRFEEEARAASVTNADVFYARKPLGEDWTPAVLVNEHAEADDAFVNRPLLAVDGDRVVVVWSVYLATNLLSANRIEWSYVQTGDDEAWAAPTVMIAGRGESFGGRLLDLEADPTGGVILVFGRQSTDTFLFMRRLPALATEWEPDILLTYGDRGSYPSLTVAQDGSAYVVYNIGAGADANVAGVGVFRGAITPGPEVILTGEIDGAQGRAAITTDATSLPWVLYYSQPEGELPNAVEAIRNFVIPRSLAELDALVEATGGSDDD